jgi:hypothetical protein
MGKNTMMRKAIRGHMEKNPLLERYESMSGESHVVQIKLYGIIYFLSVYRYCEIIILFLL